MHLCVVRLFTRRKNHYAFRSTYAQNGRQLFAKSNQSILIPDHF